MEWNKMRAHSKKISSQFLIFRFGYACTSSESQLQRDERTDFYDDFQELRFKNSGSCGHCAVTATPSDFTCSGGRRGRCRHLYKMGNRRDRSHGSRNTVAAWGSRAKYCSLFGLHWRGCPRAFLRGGCLSKGERQQTNYAALANLSSLCR